MKECEHCGNIIEQPSYCLERPEERDMAGRKRRIRKHLCRWCDAKYLQHLYNIYAKREINNAV